MATDHVHEDEPPVWPDRPALVPLVQRWQCCHCGGGGLDSAGQTCPHCDGHGHT